MHLEERKSAISFWRRDKASSKTVFGPTNNFFGKDKLCISGFQANRREDKTWKIQSKVLSHQRWEPLRQRNEVQTCQQTLFVFWVLLWEQLSQSNFFTELPNSTTSIHAKSRQVIEIAARTFARWEEEETVRKEQFKGIYARHRKKKKRQEKYSWMSLGWLRFFGTSVNKEEKENSCGLCA